MLVLSRLRDETIMIGDDVQITIVDIRGDKVRLGISAPTRIAVHRKEVYDAIKSENKRASKLAPNDVTSLHSALSPGPPRAPNARAERRANAAPTTTIQRLGSEGSRRHHSKTE